MSIRRMHVKHLIKRSSNIQSLGKSLSCPSLITTLIDNILEVSKESILT